MHLPLPPIVKVQFVDLETQNNVYPSLTAILKDMRTKLIITLMYPPTTADVDSAIVTIARKDGSEKGKQYDLNLGQNVIGHSNDHTADIKHAFEINVPYTVKMGVDLYNGDKYVSEFTYGDKVNEPSYSEFIYRDPENLDKFNDDATQFKLVNHEYYQEGGTIKIDCPIDFNQPLDTRKPISVGFTFDEVDNYPGTANDSDNTEQTAAYITVQYRDDGAYEFLVADMRGRLNNDSVYTVLVTAKYADGHQIQQTLDDYAHLIVNPTIVVESYGLGSDGTGAGDLNTSTAAVLYVQKNTIGSSESKIPANDDFVMKFSQNGEDKYTAQLSVSNGVITSRLVEGEETEFFTYTVLNNELTKVGTPLAESDGTHNFDAQIFARYDTLPGTSIDNLEKPSNIVPGTYVNDYTPLTQVDVANAWMAATNVVSSGDREVNMADATTVNGYDAAPQFGIVGSFHKTADFGSGFDGLLKDLDVAATMFKYEISVTTNGHEHEEEVWRPVEKIHQIQGAVGNTLQENYIAVMTAPEQANDEGKYTNIPGATGISGPLQPRVYFRICETQDFLIQEDQIVKVRVTIVPEGKTTDVGSKESAMCLVVKKIKRHIMTPHTFSEPLFKDDVLYIPIHAEEDADLNFISARFQSNLAGENANLPPQTDAEDADEAEGNDEDDNDHKFNLVVNNPNKRGSGPDNAIKYTVTYKINDPNGGTISIKSVEYTINISDEPTTSNFTVTNYSYKTFNEHGLSGFEFDVSFTDGDSTGIDGVNVYFESNNDDTDPTNDISRTFLMNVSRIGGAIDNQQNLFVILNDVHPENSDATSGVTVNDINGVDSTRWFNYKSGSISFVPYKNPRVFGSIIDGDEEVVSEYNNAQRLETIMHIPIIDMADEIELVSGVVESYKGTQLTWYNDSSRYVNTSVTLSYDLVYNGVNVSAEVVADSADSSKLSYPVSAAPALSSLKFEIRTKLVSDVDSTVYYSEPVTVEFTSASVDLSGATAVVKRGSSVETLKALLNGYETTDASNLNVTEFKLVDAGSAEKVCTATQDGVETVLTDAQIGITEGGVIADSSRSIITIDPDVDGWSIKNTYAVDATTRPKVNLYYYGNAVAEAATNPKGDALNANNSFTLSEARGLGLYAVFYQNQGAKEYPFFNAYTARTSYGTNKSWYKSKVFYGPESNQGDTTADSGNAGLTLIYTGSDDGSLFSSITKRVQYVVKVGPNLTNANDGYASEAIWLLSLQTSGADTSSSESYNFRVIETGIFTSHNNFGQLSLTYNVGDDVTDPERPAVNVLPTSTTGPVQAVNSIHTYDLSQGGYGKSDTLQLFGRMKACVSYTEKRGDSAAETKYSQSTYLSLVPEARTAYVCASRPNVEVVGTRVLVGERKAINLKINANGLEREGMQSVIMSLFKEADHTVAVDDAEAQGSEIVLSFESTSGRVRSYTVDEDGANVTTGSTDNLGPGEQHELLNNDVYGFSETALPSTSTFILEMGSLDHNDESKLYLPVDSEWDDGVVTVLAVVSTRLGTDVDYGTVSSD